MKPVGCTGSAPSGILVEDSISWTTVSSEIKNSQLYVYIKYIASTCVIFGLSLLQPNALQTMSLNELSTSRFSFFNDNEDL
jgi:hypothetical protein